MSCDSERREKVGLASSFKDCELDVLATRTLAPKRRELWLVHGATELRGGRRGKEERMASVDCQCTVPPPKCSSRFVRPAERLP